MPEYKAPVRDVKFLVNDVFDYATHYANLPGGEEATPDMVDAIIEEKARFCEEVIAPLNRSGDEEGCTLNEDGTVTTPKGFKEAYQQYVESGWPSLPHDPEYGGQGLPHSLDVLMQEFGGSANWSWIMYPGLSHGCMNTLTAHGTPEQKATYLPNLISGEWTGTMCLTEPHCGTDLGMLRTKADPQADGSYKLSGTKIFISAGEHDMSDNIIHIVIARIAGAPNGTKGISLFIVPKFLLNEDGSVGERNGVSCGSLEHKMGIHGNSTCVMNFDGATGYLIGPENRGLNCMFTFMNTARLGTGIQGISHAEVGYQFALEYARDRLQMRSLSGPKAPDKPADPIIVHPDVRRMLLTARSFAQGNRALAAWTAQVVDILEHGRTEEERQHADLLLGFITPIIKAFMTETGFESANLGMQCFGGHGYISEWGMEQNVRDARISLLYEGTTGIQALDLLGRKVLMNNGAGLKAFTKEIYAFAKANENDPVVGGQCAKLRGLIKEWLTLTTGIGVSAMKNRDEVGGASVDFLMYSGYIVLGWMWSLMAKTASEKLAAGSTETEFMNGKIKTAEFYYARILPRTRAHKESIEAGVDTMLAIADEEFA